MTDSQKYEIAERLAELHDEKAELTAQVKAVNAEFDELEAQLVADLITNESGGFNFQGRNFTLVRKEHFGENKENRDELYTELKERGHADMFSVHAGTLQKQVKEWTESNEGVLPDWLDGLINVYTENTIQIRKGRKV